MHRLTASLTNSLRVLRGLLFPLDCVGCGAALAAESDLAACEPCLAKLVSGAGPADPRTAEGLDALMTASGWSRAARKLLYRFKINADPGAETVVRRLLERFAGTRGFGGPYDAVVPVPPRSRFPRSSRAADKLAREIAALVGAPVVRVLSPSRRLKKQSSLGRAERARNVRGAFRASRSAAGLRSVLVVDDVVTTGATARECAAALRRAGVSRVSAFALARGGAS